MTNETDIASIMNNRVMEILDALDFPPKSNTEKLISYAKRAKDTLIKAYDIPKDFQDEIIFEVKEKSNDDEYSIITGNLFTALLLKIGYFPDTIGIGSNEYKFKDGEKLSKAKYIGNNVLQIQPIKPIDHVDIGCTLTDK